MEKKRKPEKIDFYNARVEWLKKLGSMKNNSFFNIVDEVYTQNLRDYLSRLKTTNNPAIKGKKFLLNKSNEGAGYKCHRVK